LFVSYYLDITLNCTACFMRVSRIVIMLEVQSTGGQIPILMKINEAILKLFSKWHESESRGSKK